MHSPSQPHGNAAVRSAATDAGAAAATDASVREHSAHEQNTHDHSAHDHGTHRSATDHRRAVRELLEPLLSPERAERLPLVQALGRGLAEDVIAPLSLPPFPNSQMDGFAIRSADVPDGGARLRVAAPVPAGAHPAPLQPGTAAPIMTGAMVPAGADAVVPIEQAGPSIFPAAGEEAEVRLPATAAGTFIRAAGSDIESGQQALAAGTCLGPAQLGLLAALGLPEVLVNKQLSVLLVTTGDEVVEPGEPLGDGKIYDANGTILESALRQAGLAVTRAGISADSPDALRTLLRTHTSAVDLIVTTGGVSKGAYEVVRQAMDGQDVAFQHVAMQPGGPQGLGTFDGVPLLAFPGNPVSCLVSFEMFLRPVLGELFGAPAPRPAVRAKLAQPLSSPAGKHQVRRGSLQADGTVRLQGGESSHLVQALAHSNALVHVPVGTAALEEGAEVEVWML
ncbi:molybdopterin molybdotransferase MoeA [Arthrobacter globiformis]|uniref:molybdopterin molybdotransferase MoeA n=1 Tax=Arthrobacter globiformis TaxID=1665 RepID=UPI0027900651|nr:gephyrin-like molybdotransferase Glp [Arthrobacter globiformis]MDQ0617785.1 molybdopterin molybdotransferase [Arthrobacter globiformis]